MRRFIILLAFFIASHRAFAEREPSELNPQVILVSDTPRKFAWRDGMRLSDVIANTTGLHSGLVFLVRRGVAEKLKPLESLNRTLEPWDIIVVGYQRSSSP